MAIKKNKSYLWKSIFIASFAFTMIFSIFDGQISTDGILNGGIPGFQVIAIFPYLVLVLIIDYIALFNYTLTCKPQNRGNKIDSLYFVYIPICFFINFIITGLLTGISVLPAPIDNRFNYISFGLTTFMITLEFTLLCVSRNKPAIRS